MVDPDEMAEVFGVDRRTNARDLAIFRDEQRRRRARSDNALFAFACAIAAALFVLAWWLLP